MKNTSFKDLRNFGISFSILLILISYFIFKKQNLSNSLFVLLFFAGFFLISSITFPKLINPFHLIFFRVTRIITWINTRIILTLIFYLILTPLGLLLKIFNKKLLDLKIQKNMDKNFSYWKKHPSKKETKQNLEKQY